MAAPANQSPMRTIRSASGQFIVRGVPFTRPMPNDPSPGAKEVDLDPSLLVVSCENIKAALLRELLMPDIWYGPVYIRIQAGVTNNLPVHIAAEPVQGGWRYQVEVPERIENTRLMRGIVQVLLLEMANRSSTGRSAEIPLWLTEGLTQILLHSRELHLVVPQPSMVLNNIPLSLQGRQGVRRDPLAEARDRLQTNAAFTFTRLSEPPPEELPDETWKTYQASAQLLVTELLALPQGRARMVAFLGLLPRQLNWQQAFLEAYDGRFSRMLDVEKWWALVLSHFTGTDPSNSWSPETSLEKLSEILKPMVLMPSGGSGAAQRKTVTLQEVVADPEYSRQRPTLQGVIAQLTSVRFKVSPFVRPIVDDYRQSLESYLANRERSAVSRFVLRAGSQEKLASDTILQLNDLDMQRKNLLARDQPGISIEEATREDGNENPRSNP